MFFIYAVVILYCLSLLLVFLFSIGQLHLTYLYLQKKKSGDVEPKMLVTYPHVTIQLPIYNEQYVVKRLLKAVTSIEYLPDKLEIQVLDDSTDETTDIIAGEVKQYQAQGIDIVHIRRGTREGFKAGALADGLTLAKGEFVAVFDADFIPGPEFLLKSIPHFSNDKVGVVQARWGHLNRSYSLLTRLQAFGLDAHFSVEQSGRSAAGSFINFNGTGGVWRRECIDDAGGWSADTLTEDLDLSYRAQLRGWKFKYLEDYEAPAELPVIMPAIKSQQYRWNKGAAETAKKHILEVLRSKISFTNKLHAFFHLFNSSIFICILVAAILSIPMVFIKSYFPQFDYLFTAGSILLIGFFSIALFYWVATKNTISKGAFFYYLNHLPLFLMVSMGLSLHNGNAVWQGLTGKRSAFIRTPKFNIISESDTWKGNKYIKLKINWLTITEGLMCLYFLSGIIAGISIGIYDLILFHVMLTTGFALVFTYSIRALRYV